MSLRSQTLLHDHCLEDNGLDILVVPGSPCQMLSAIPIGKLGIDLLRALKSRLRMSWIAPEMYEIPVTYHTNKYRNHHWLKLTCPRTMDAPGWNNITALVSSELCIAVRD